VPRTSRCNRGRDIASGPYTQASVPHVPGLLTHVSCKGLECSTGKTSNPRYHAAAIMAKHTRVLVQNCELRGSRTLSKS
jgi:hypothetical protein